MKHRTHRATWRRARKILRKCDAYREERNYYIRMDLAGEMHLVEIERPRSIADIISKRKGALGNAKQRKALQLADLRSLPQCMRVFSPSEVVGQLEALEQGLSALRAWRLGHAMPDSFQSLRAARKWLKARL